MGLVTGYSNTSKLRVIVEESRMLSTRVAKHALMQRGLQEAEGEAGFAQGTPPGGACTGILHRGKDIMLVTPLQDSGCQVAHLRVTGRGRKVHVPAKHIPKKFMLLFIVKVKRENGATRGTSNTRGNAKAVTNAKAFGSRS